MLTFCRCQQYPMDVYYHGYRKKWKEMKMIFRLFSYFVWLKWPSVVGRWIRLRIGNNVIRKKHTWFHLKKWSWPSRSFSVSTDKEIAWSSMTAFSNTETFVWNIFGYDQSFECYSSVTLYVPHPVYVYYFAYNRLNLIFFCTQIKES